MGLTAKKNEKSMKSMDDMQKKCIMKKVAYLSFNCVMEEERQR